MNKLTEDQIKLAMKVLKVLEGEIILKNGNDESLNGIDEANYRLAEKLNKLKEHAK